MIAREQQVLATGAAKVMLDHYVSIFANICNMIGRQPMHYNLELEV